MHGMNAKDFEVQEVLARGQKHSAIEPSLNSRKEPCVHCEGLVSGIKMVDDFVVVMGSVLLDDNKALWT
jgi:hypothetical protein